jgi:preprotein translocase subunit YajC
MNQLFVIAAQAGGAGAPGYANIALLVGVFVVIYFFMIRPQQKRRKELQNFRSEIKKGDKIITIGGIYGKVNDIKENVVTIEIAPNTTMKLDKNAIVPDTKDLQKQQ